VSTQPTLRWLSGCWAEIYAALGENAPRLLNDSYVVAVHEIARQAGAVAHKLAEPSERDSCAVIGEVLSRAVAADPEGNLVLYVLSSVVGPRLLISMRDATIELREKDDSVALAALEGAPDVLVRAIRRIADLTRPHGPIEDDDWIAAARSLENACVEAGFAESFGLSRPG